MGARRYSFRLTRGGWGLLVVCILLSLGAFRAGLNMTYLLASLLIAVFLCSLLLPLWNLRGLVCRRAVADAAFANERFRVHHWIYSTRRTVARLLRVEEPLCNGKPGKGRPACTLALEVPPRGSVRLSCMASPRKRGVYPMPELRWSSCFPFGIAEWSMSNPPAGDLVVYPARGTLTAPVSSALRPRGIRAEAIGRYGQMKDEFRSVREYQPGDNPRRIHWRASAHIGRLCVMEMERERSAPVIILLDSRIPASTPAAERAEAAEAIETAVSFAAEVCRAAQAAGNPMTLVGFFPETRVIRLETRGGAGPATAEWFGLLDALARLKPSEAETADELLRSAEAIGIAPALRLIAVTPTSRSASGLSQPILSGTEMKLYVAANPGFSSIFRPTAQVGHQGHEN